MRLSVLAIAMAMTFVLPLVGCGRPTYTYRYKLVLEIETPEGVKRGESVVETTEYTVMFPHDAVRAGTTGEGIYIDMGAGRPPLVTLVTVREGSTQWPFGARPTLHKLYGGQRYEWIKDRNPGLAALIKNRGVKNITIDQLPEIVTFSDPAKPITIATVDPRNLEASFGPGVKWHRMTLEFTDDPATTGLEKKLPWLAEPKYREIMLDGERSQRLGSSATLANSLSVADFARQGF